ncbi:MAG: glycoside hydrolase family 97 protein [Bacteroidota bacterium]|nr:glycoside hydrolase family 97 protein [Bacteroidota bacterium]
MNHFNKNKFYRITFILFITFAISNLLQAQSRQAIVVSPDGQIQLKLFVKDHHLNYQVDYHKQVLMPPSALGLTVDNNTTNEVNSLGAIRRSVIKETYPWRGVHSIAVNHCNDALFNIKGTVPSSSFTFEAKVFDNGIAFRYILQGTGKREVNADGTIFKIPAGSVIWSQGDIGNYEGKYQQQNIDEVKEGQLAGPPLTIRLPNNMGYAAITEGGVIDFAGMSLKATGNNAFAANLTGITNINGNIQTPWRIIEIGKDLNTLVNCDIISNVSPAPDKTLFPDGFNTRWIRPGKSVWSWLAGNGGVTFENMKTYSKWAGKLGFEYNLVDEGWSQWHDGGKDKWALLKELVDYSNEQHVKVWVWKAYPDRNGVPGLKEPKARREFFEQCKQAGVVGLKIDFFDNESQEVLNFYQEALKDAAKLHLMLDFHGADKPTGQSRTWLNEMSREGIRGLENPNNWAKHNATLPFTRFLAGHGDYTPLSLRQDLIKGTTITHQVATVITFTSPFMCLAVNPQALLTSPIKEMITGMPTTWDETIVLPQSEIGGVAVYARRKGSTWYLAAVNGEAARDLNIALSFMGKGSYHAVLMEDDKHSVERTVITNKSVSRTSTIVLNLQPGGGFAAKLVK